MADNATAELLAEPARTEQTAQPLASDSTSAQSGRDNSAASATSGEVRADRAAKTLEYYRDTFDKLESGESAEPAKVEPERQPIRTATEQPAQTSQASSSANQSEGRTGGQTSKTDESATLAAAGFADLHRRGVQTLSQ